MIKIGVISDTHGTLRKEVKRELESCEIILHGGDAGSPEILEELGKIAKVYAVRGNADQDWVMRLPQDLRPPETIRLEYGGIRIFMIHNRKKIKENIENCDIAVFGHSHKYEEKRKDGILWLNPGSCGPKRFTLPVTMAVLEVEEDASYRVKRIDIPVNGDASAGRNDKERPDRKKEGMGSRMDRRELVIAIMKDTNRGRTIEEIASRYGISEEFAAQICRLYVTHPGIDAEGIINKMG